MIAVAEAGKTPGRRTFSVLTASTACLVSTWSAIGPGFGPSNVEMANDAGLTPLFTCHNNH
jgi:hypothetical protein